jgi:hypothetical protein
MNAKDRSRLRRLQVGDPVWATPSQGFRTKEGRHGHMVHKTAKAVLVMFPDGRQDWFPAECIA